MPVNEKDVLYIFLNSKVGRTTNWNSNGNGKLSRLIGSSPILVDMLPNTAWVMLNFIFSWLNKVLPYSIGHSWESKGNSAKSKLQENVSWNASPVNLFALLPFIFEGKSQLPDESVWPYTGVSLNSFSRSKEMTGCQNNLDSSSVRIRALHRFLRFH